jgi:O-antigen ligase
MVQLQQDLEGNIGDKDGSEPRMARWHCAWELIRASPWIGYGTGTEVDLLKEKYVTHQLYDSYAHDLNAHNQYLSFLLKTGLPGELLYLGILAIGFLQAFRLKDPFLGSFLLIVACVSASENILDVNKGIFFFSFFFSFFLAKPANTIFVRHYGNKNTLPLMGT